jgi:hypothetical protein
MVNFSELFPVKREKEREASADCAQVKKIQTHLQMAE